MSENGRARPGRRERYRVQTRHEAKDIALRQLAEAGPAAISLNAIAREMGMSGPALYHYFAGRDELLTELVIDAYDDLADTLSQAVRPDAAPSERLRAVAVAYRAWALAQPHRYLLIFGTPVPGYAAPEQATAAAHRGMVPIMEALIAADPPPAPAGTAVAALETKLARPEPWAPAGASGAVRHRALSFWARLHGVVSLEVQGQFAPMDFDPEALFEAEIETLLSW